MTAERMPDAVRFALTAMARSSSTREICGFIMKDWSIHHMTNVSLRDDQFSMDNEALLEFFQKSYNDVLGVYHSHWDGQEHPSDVDQAYYQGQWRYWIVTFDGVHEWELRDGEFVRVSA